VASRKRLRWTAILCCHAIANMASYRGGLNGRNVARVAGFWRRTNGNFMDIAVLEWCKLFADRSGFHCWRNVVSDPDRFEAELLEHLGMTAADLQDYCTSVRTYRDKFVAHLDDDPKAKYPRLDVAIESTKVLYKYLLTHEDRGNYFEGLPRNLESAYRIAFSQAKAAYPCNEPRDTSQR
jgi:hypothetical protein